MIIPLRTDSRLYSTPYMNWALIAVNVLVFLVEHTVWPEIGQRYALQPRNLQLIQYFTYQFLHGGAMHIGGNMLFLYIFGNNVNDRMGNWGYLGFYLGGGVFAGIVQLISSSSPVPIVGASGSISAVTGAFLVLLPRSHITLVYFYILIGSIEIPSIWFIGLSFAWDFILAFGQGGGNVANGAHVGGSVFGVAVSFVLLTVRFLPRDQFDMYALFQRWNRRRQYQDMVRQGFDPFGHIRPSRAVPDPRMERIQDMRAQISEALAHHKVEDAARFYLELHAIDPQQVLSRQNQLDVANQLFAQEVYGAASDAYEAFIKAYPKYEQIEQVQLMLGLLYARYLNRPDRARDNLQNALLRLSRENEIELAKAELAKIQSGVAGM